MAEQFTWRRNFAPGPTPGQSLGSNIDGAAPVVRSHGGTAMRHLGVIALLFIPAYAMAGESSRLLERMPEAKRLDTLATVVRSVGDDCDTATKYFYKGEEPKSNQDFFAVRCGDGKDYLVAIENTGNMSSTVTECNVLKLVGVECWTPF